MVLLSLSLFGITPHIFPNQETLSLLPFPSLTPKPHGRLCQRTSWFWEDGIWVFFFFFNKLFIFLIHFIIFTLLCVLMSGAIITGEDAGFVLPAATRSTHAVTVITRPRYFFLSPLFLLQIICLFAFISSGLVLFSQSELVEESLWSPRARSPRC